MNMIRYFLVFLLTCVLFISGCTQERQTAPNQAIPEGFEALTLTDQQKNEIFESAEKVGVDKVYVPAFVSKGQKLVKIETSTEQVKFLELIFADENESTYLEILEASEEVLLGGVVIEEKETTINNDIPAKWISFSNHKDNIEAASAGLYFKKDTSFIRVREQKDNQTFRVSKSVEEIASSLQPLTR